MGALATNPPIVLLLATLPERSQLLQRAVASVIAQHVLPVAAVVVCDGGKLAPSSVLGLEASSVPTHYLNNLKALGAAGAWNKGIRYITKRWPHCYVAILDDDDEWDVTHLAACLGTARRCDWPDVVLSGLRLIYNGVEQTREPVCEVQVQDFLAGNPGWQGSNTFIRLATLRRAGGFTPGLKSCNDRDLAIRVLSLEGVRIAYTGLYTSSWHLDTDRKVLTEYRSQQKLEGLAHFYHLHNCRMSYLTRRLFFQRASDLFGWQQDDIMQRAKERQHAYTCSPHY